MEFSLPPVGGIGSAAPPARTTAPKPATQTQHVSPAVRVETIPASPPPDVLEQMQAAAQVAEQLRAQERELHFEPTGSGRVVIQVRDLDGKVIRTVPPAEALSIAAGAPVE